jgi:phosphoglucomutase
MDLSSLQKQELIKKATNYIQWEENDYFKNEVLKAVEEEAYEELYECFYTTLSFGTAGVRGIIGGGTNRINPFMISRVTQGFANYLLNEVENPTVVIAFDSRNYSKTFANQAALNLCANKIKVYLYDEIRPVPMLSYALRHLKADAGIVITASHNPAKYNGYKVYWNHGGQVTYPHDEAIIKSVNTVELNQIKKITKEEAIKEKLLFSVDESVDNAYYQMIIDNLINKEAFEQANVKVTYTPLHGSGKIPLIHLFDKLNVSYQIVEEQKDADGNFPTVSMPNPEDPDAMKLAIKLAIKNKSDIVLGTDPDADRLGIAIPKDDSKNEYILLNGNEIAVLLVDYLINCKKESRQGVVVKSLVTTDLVKEIVQKNGGVCLDVLTGFKYIAQKIEQLENSKEQYFLFGCEESFGYLFLEQIRDKDAVSSALLATEMLSYYKTKDISLQQRLAEIYQQYGFYSEKVLSFSYEGSQGAQKMANIMASFRSLEINSSFANFKIAKKIDLLNDKESGFPPSDVVILEFDSGDKMVIRPSGTEPKIKYYLFFKSETKDKVEFESLVSNKIDQIKGQL